MTDSKNLGARALLSPRWIITSLLVIAAVLGMVRLGMWQIDRAEERRAFNEQVTAQIDAPALALNSALASASLAPADLLGMEYRPVQLSGVYDPQHEIIWRNQVLDGRPGYHVLTPLRIDGLEQAVLIDRGFIPLEARTPADRARYIQDGPAEVQGIIRLARVPRFAGAPELSLAPGETRRDAWNALRMDQIQQQVPYPLLPVYVQAAAPPGQEQAAGQGQAAAQETQASGSFPVAQLERPEISEGSHMGYALQWFTFAALLAVGYPFFVRKQLRGR